MHNAGSSWFPPHEDGLNDPHQYTIPSERSLYWALFSVLTLPPELQITSDGTPFTRFSSAVNRSYKSSSGEKVEVELTRKDGGSKVGY